HHDQRDGAAGDQRRHQGDLSRAARLRLCVARAGHQDQHQHRAAAGADVAQRVRQLEPRAVRAGPDREADRRWRRNRVLERSLRRRQSGERCRADRHHHAHGIFPAPRRGVHWQQPPRAVQCSPSTTEAERRPAGSHQPQPRHRLAVPSKDTLFIRWRDQAPNGVVAATLWTPTGGAQNVSAPLTDLAARATGKSVVVFVAAADVRLATVDVPARSPQKVLQAAPYALEDQLAEDVDVLHFALGPRQAAGGYPVAVVAKSRMDAWLAPLTEAGLRPEALVPEQLALPWVEDDRIHLLAEAGELTARTGPFRGFACAPEDLAAVLKIADPENRYTLRV